MTISKIKASTKYTTNLKQILAQIFTKIINNFKVKNYAAIDSYVTQNVSKISKAPNIHIEDAPGGQKREYISTEDSYRASAYIKSFGERSIDCTVRLTGTFVYDTNTGKISGYSGPSLSFSFSPVGESEELYEKADLNSVSTKARISSDKYSIDFSATYDVTGTYNNLFPVTWAKNKYISMTGTGD